MSNLSNTEKKRRFVVFGLLTAAVIFVIILLIFLFFSPEKPVSSARMVQPRSDTVQGGVGGIGTTQYNEKLKEHDAKKADAALTAGESFVPTPVGHRQPALQKKEEKAPISPPVAPVRTVPPVPAKTNNALLKRMMEDLNASRNNQGPNSPPFPWVVEVLYIIKIFRKKSKLLLLKN